MWLCLPVRLHTCAHTPTTYLYLPECTPLHFHSLLPPRPPCICRFPHSSTSVIVHTGFAHRPWSLSRVGPQNRYVCGVRQLAGPPAQGRARRRSAQDSRISVPPCGGGEGTCLL